MTSLPSAYSEGDDGENFVAEIPPPPECCRGWSAQTGTKIIAIFSLCLDILAIIYLIAGSIFLLQVAEPWPDDSVIKIGFIVALLLLLLVNLTFNVFLLRGAIQGNPVYCKDWLTYSKVMAGISIVILWLTITKNIFWTVGQAVGIGRYFYSIFIVNEFVMDMQANPRRYRRSRLSRLQ